MKIKKPYNTVKEVGNDIKVKIRIPKNWVEEGELENQLTVFREIKNMFKQELLNEIVKRVADKIKIPKIDKKKLEKAIYKAIAEKEAYRNSAFYGRGDLE
jgi:hypothetical protein